MRTWMAEEPGALLTRVAGGDEAALAALYDRYAGVLYGFALRRLGDHERAEELVQRVMTRVWRFAERYDPERGQVSTWVFAIARTAVADLQRDVFRRRRIAEAAPPDVGDDELEQLLLSEAVRVAFDRLSHEHREVLHLAYFQGLTQSEAAARLGLPLGTVKSRTYYALRALRLACEELEVAP